jgi:hypothetical protein
MGDGKRYRAGRAVNREGPQWALFSAKQFFETVTAKPSNDNVDDLDPFINLILAAAVEKAAVPKNSGRCGEDGVLGGAASPPSASDP